MEILAKTKTSLSMNARDMAKACGVTERTLYDWRKQCGFPFFISPGGAVMYPVAEARRWISKRSKANAVKAGA